MLTYKYCIPISKLCVYVRMLLTGRWRYTPFQCSVTDSRKLKPLRMPGKIKVAWW